MTAHDLINHAALRIELEEVRTLIGVGVRPKRRAAAALVTLCDELECLAAICKAHHVPHVDPQPFIVRARATVQALTAGRWVGVKPVINEGVGQYDDLHVMAVGCRATVRMVGGTR